MILAIDPSINSCGTAVFNEDDKKLVFYKLIKSVDTSDSKDVFGYASKAKQIVLQLQHLVINKYSINKIILEVPEYWRIEGFAARESGSISKLTFICGMIYNINDDIEYTLYVPRMWKKQLPKEVVNNRLRKVYTNIDIAHTDHNVVDAIGIGHYYLHGNVG